MQYFGKDNLMGIMHLPWKFSTHFHALLYFSTTYAMFETDFKLQKTTVLH